MQITFSGIMLAVAAIAAHQLIMLTSNDSAMAQSLALTTFAIGQASLALSLRFPEVSAFRRETFSNWSLNVAIIWSVAAMLLVTEVPLLRSVFHTTPLSPEQWGLCLLLSLEILLLGEAAKPLLKLIPRKQG